jgi:hypothetical protein
MYIANDSVKRELTDILRGLHKIRANLKAGKTGEAERTLEQVGTMLSNLIIGIKKPSVGAAGT